MLIGEYQTTIGDKNRVALPKKLRDGLSGTLIITRGYEKSLIIVDREKWRRLIDEINKKPLLTISVRDTKRYLIGGAIEIEPDSQGRFVIPESLRTFAGIEEKLIILGVGEWIEIWNDKEWESRLNSLTENVGGLLERLSEI